jgi:hypothetical protein
LLAVVSLAVNPDKVVPLLFSVVHNMKEMQKWRKDDTAQDTFFRVPRAASAD